MIAHPTVNLLCFNLTASDMEDELWLVTLQYLPFLPLSYDSLHLFLLDLLIEAPFTDP